MNLFCFCEYDIESKRIEFEGFLGDFMHIETKLYRISNDQIKFEQAFNAQCCIIVTSILFQCFTHSASLF